MTVGDSVTFRSIILPSEIFPAIDRAGQLLNDLGHEVANADSPNHALELLQQDRTDLLVVDVSNSPANRQFVSELAGLPASDRPRQVAIFSDATDDGLRSLRSRMKPTKVHVFLKPLHMHGLLTVLRQLEGAV